MTTRPGSPANTQPDTRVLGSMMDVMHDRLSNAIAGGARQDYRAFTPEGDELPPDEGIFPPAYQENVPEELVPADALEGLPDDLAALPQEQLTKMFGLSYNAQGFDGDGGDWYRGGEADNNFANRHNPLYQSRRDFAMAINPVIEEMFDVDDGGSAGYYRPYDPAHAAPGGPSGNSDHYSAGAIDYFGTPEELQRLRNWLVNQPWVSFVRWKSESHYDHVHVSISMPYVIENWAGNRQLPTVTGPDQGPTASASQAREQQRGPDLPETVQADELTVPDVGGARPI